MHTPYEILQLKQKQKRKIICELKKQRAFSVRSDKHGSNATTYHIEKQKPISQPRYQTIPVQMYQHNKFFSQQKKYQIVFRQSIRKVNAYRTKVYHTHAALKKQKFMKRLTTTKPENQSPRYGEYPQNNKKIHSNRQDQSQFKICNPQKACESMKVGKYRIYFTRSPQKLNHNQIAPQFSVEKCKLNITQNDYKQKIEKTIKSLYNHNKKMQMAMKNHSIESFTQRDNFSQQTPTNNSFNNFFDNFDQVKTKLKSPKSTNDIKQQIKHLKQGENFISKGQILQKQCLQDIKVANFIRSKKKRRLPISTLRTSKPAYMEGFEFKRTITDTFTHKTKRPNFLKNTERYFSPNKSTRCGARIKFNSIQENISGWQFQPFQNNQPTPLAKTPRLQV